MTATRARVLVVDDSRMQREILRRVLEERGHTVRVASGAVEGIAATFSWRPDVVVSDVVMPGIGGYHLCRFIKNDSRLHDTPVILLTSSAVRRQDRFWGMKSGADAYITKGADPAPLLETLERLVAGRPRIGLEPEAAGAGAAETEIATSIHALFDRLLFETTVSNEVRALSALVNDRERLLGEFAGLADSLLDTSILAVAVFCHHRPLLYLSLKTPAGRSGVRGIGRAVARATGDDALLASAADIDVVARPESLYEADHVALGITRGICVPMRVGVECVGALYVLPAEGAIAPRSDLLVLSRELGPVVATLRYHGEVQRLSICDDMTGLSNARWVMQCLHREWERHKRYGGTFSLIIMDIDEFKQVNDTWGHLAGDAVLRAVADVLRGVRREVDVIARYGGDEFFLLLPETALEGAEVVAQRLIEGMRSLVVEVAEARIRVTGSFGVTQVSAGCRGVDDVIAAADGALYDAKAAGRDRCCSRVKEPSGEHEPGERDDAPPPISRRDDAGPGRDP